MSENKIDYEVNPNIDLTKFESRSNHEVIQSRNSNQQFLDIVERLATNPNADVAKIQQILDVQTQILDRNAKQDFNASFVRAQARMDVVIKNAKSEHGKFADLEAVLEMARPIYTSEGFAVTFYEGFSSVLHPLKDGYIRMNADIMHSGGHTKTVTADVPIDDKGPQGKVIKTSTHATGSSFSYGRRYLNCMIWNIATGDDDDGNMGKDKVCISPEMVTEIKSQIKGTGTELSKFLKYMKAASVETILLADYGKAIVSLEAKAKANALTERQPGDETDDPRSLSHDIRG